MRTIGSGNDTFDLGGGYASVVEVRSGTAVSGDTILVDDIQGDLIMVTSQGRAHVGAARNEVTSIFIHTGVQGADTVSVVANDCWGIDVSTSDEADQVTVSSNTIYVLDLSIELLGGNDWVNFSYNAQCLPMADPIQLGDFRIERPIGAGGMGIVYLARQVSLDRLVALKVLGQSLTRQGDKVRFQREAQAVAKLNHPGIARVHFVGQGDKLCYMAMEYVGGVSL